MGLRVVGPTACILNGVVRSFFGLFWMSARIGENAASIERPLRTLTGFYFAGERLSPYVALACIAMAVTILIQ